MIGFLNIYKPKGITSNAVVQQIKKHFYIDKVGHMGTLDPMACGLLPIAIGKATRLFDFMLQKKKAYNVIFDFGYETDTLDITGTKIKENNVDISEEQILDIISKMKGIQMQMPPKYSAKNINGCRAYDLARKGIEFELKEKEIEIFEFNLIKKVGKNSFMFNIVCSSGTYIRSIGRDLGYKLGTFGTMSFLERCDMDFFKLSNSVNLEQLLLSEKIEDYLLSPLDVLNNFEKIIIDEKTYKNLIDGKFVAYNKEIKQNSFVIFNGEIVGVSKPRQNQLKLDCFLKENI